LDPPGTLAMAVRPLSARVGLKSYGLKLGDLAFRSSGYLAQETDDEDRNHLGRHYTNRDLLLLENQLTAVMRGLFKTGGSFRGSESVKADRIGCEREELK
jgi:hypothetical protein